MDDLRWTIEKQTDGDSNRESSIVNVLVDGFASVWSNDRMGRGKRILAVDYGKKNIGLACSDELGVTIQPLPSIPNLGPKNVLRTLKNTVLKLGIEELILGIPLNMDGTRGESVRQIEQLMSILKTELELPLAGVDERLSTVEALEFWRNMSSRQQKKYRTVDSLAAAFILQRYLGGEQSCDAHC
jgi:putative holliday junction resolvase